MREVEVQQQQPTLQVENTQQLSAVIVAGVLAVYRGLKQIGFPTELILDSLHKTVQEYIDSYIAKKGG